MKDGKGSKGSPQCLKIKKIIYPGEFNSHLHQTLNDDIKTKDPFKKKRKKKKFFANFTGLTDVMCVYIRMRN